MGTPPKGRPPISMSTFPSMMAPGSTLGSTPGTSPGDSPGATSSPSEPKPPAGLNISSFSSYSSIHDSRAQKKSLLGGNPAFGGKPGGGAFGGDASQKHQSNGSHANLPRCPSPNTTLGRPGPSPQSSYPVSPESSDESSPSVAAVPASQKSGSVLRSVSGTGNSFLGGGNSFLGRSGATGAVARLAGESNNGSATPPRTFANEFSAKVTNQLHELGGNGGGGSGTSSTASSGEVATTAIDSPPVNAICLNMQEVEDVVAEKEFSKAVLQFIDITTISSSVDDDGTQAEYVIWGLKFSDAAGWEFPAKAAAPATASPADSPPRAQSSAPLQPGASGYFGAPRIVPTVIPPKVANLAERGAQTIAPSEEPMKRLNGPREVDLDLLPKYMTDDDLTRYIFD
ncbi:unnamed protein product [Closterium sp. Yama58-4]|nr:unnamed protein product [Closterium sp. Yama58-4]